MCGNIPSLRFIGIVLRLLAEKNAPRGVSLWANIDRTSRKVIYKTGSICVNECNCKVAMKMFNRVTSINILILFSLMINIANAVCCPAHFTISTCAGLTRSTRLILTYSDGSSIDFGGRCGNGGKHQF